MNRRLVLLVGILIATFVFSMLTLVVTQTNTPLTSTPKPTTKLQPKLTPKLQAIELTPSGFLPQEVRVKQGTRVTWINKSGRVATVNSALHPTHLVYPPLNLGEFANGAALQLTFTQKRTFQYHDHKNPTRTGIVVVE